MAQAVVIDALGKHAGKEQRVVANVLSHLTFAVKRGSWAVYGVRFQYHFSDVVDRFSRGGDHSEELLCVTELGEQRRNVIYDLGIANPDLFRVAPTNQLKEKLFQRFRFRIHKTSVNGPTYS